MLFVFHKTVLAVAIDEMYAQIFFLRFVFKGSSRLPKGSRTTNATMRLLTSFDQKKQIEYAKNNCLSTLKYTETIPIALTYHSRDTNFI